jgi:hypothetical protein
VQDRIRDRGLIHCTCTLQATTLVQVSTCMHVHTRRVI